MNPPTPTKRKPGLAIYWLPLDDAYFRLAAMLKTSRQAMPIYVAQRVLSEVDAHCRGSSSPLVYGLLIGELCVEPKTDRAFVLIDGALRAPPYVASGDPAAVLAPNLQSLAGEAARHGKVPIGWYRGGRTAAAAKARAEVAFHRRLFTEPWQLMLVVDGGDVSRGTFVRIEPGDGRAYSAPFFELLPDGTRSDGGKLGTVIRWENYHTLDFVVPLDASPAPRAAPANERPKEPIYDVEAPSPVQREPVAFMPVTGRAPVADAPTPADVRFAPPHMGADANADPAPVVLADSRFPRAASPPVADPADLVADRAPEPTAEPTAEPAGARAGEATALTVTDDVRTLPPAPLVADRPPSRSEVVTFPIIVPPRSDGIGKGARHLRRWAAAGVAAGVALLAARFGGRRQPR